MKIKIYFSLLLIVNVSIANEFLECEKTIQLKHYESIVKKCAKLEDNSSNAKLYKTLAVLLEKVSYKRINQIFDYGKADPLFSKLVYKKKLYTNLEKYYLKEAYKNLQQFSKIDYGFILLLYAKIAYINIMYFKIGEAKIISSDTIVLENKFKSEIYLPLLRKYISKNPEDKEALYLIGMQGVKLASSQDIKSRLVYYKVINSDYYESLKKSAELGFYRSKIVLIAVSNWENYLKQLNKAANFDDKEALYNLGIQNYNNFINGDYKKTILLDIAIDNFEKAQSLGNKDALRSLLSIYYREQPNKKRYSELLNKSVKVYGKGYLSLGNLSWCNGDKNKAKKMYLKAKEKGGYIESEAKYALDDLTKLQEPYDGCRFK